MRVSFGRAVVLAALPAVLVALGAGSAAAQPASGNPPPPKGFEADSASFVSAQTGFVLGTILGRQPDGSEPTQIAKVLTGALAGRPEFVV